MDEIKKGAMTDLSTLTVDYINQCILCYIFLLNLWHFRNILNCKLHIKSIHTFIQKMMCNCFCIVLCGFKIIVYQNYIYIKKEQVDLIE